MPASWTELNLGPEIVKLLLPQRPPMLMVDRILAQDLESARPRLRTARYVSANEPLVTGHFPGLGLVPGVITVEGLAQSAGLLGRLVTLLDDDPQLLDELTHLELGATLQPGFDPDRGQAARARIARGRALHVIGSTSIKLLAPAFPGCRLDHEVELTRRLDAGWWFTVRTEVDGVPIAQGTLSATTLTTQWPLGDSAP